VHDVTRHTKEIAMDNCPCGSGQEFAACCEPLISGGRNAATAASLMRARYSAYVKTAVQFILDSTHPSKRGEFTAEGIRRWSVNSQWHGLTILETEAGGPEDDQGTVEFIADFTEKGRRQKHHEIATFRRQDGRWYFYDGQPPPIETVRRESPKIGRNAPCPCGSGKKYKKCCMAA